MSDRKDKVTSITDKHPTNDGLQNFVAELSTNRDKRSASEFTMRKLLDKEELANMYRSDWLSRKIVDIIPNDMTREWRTFTGELDPKEVRALQEEEQRLGFPSAINDNHTWARLYGGSLIIMSIDGTGEPHEPLRLDAIKPGSLRHIKVLDETRVQRADIINNDPMSPNFGMPEYYMPNGTTTRIHHSRVLRMEGAQLPFDEFRRNNYWGDSVLMALYEALINFTGTSDSAASLVYESNVDVVKVKNLMSMLQTGAQEEALVKRFTLAKMLKSINNMMLLDSEEEHTKHTNSFAGLPELMDRFMVIVSAASDVPATRLLGTSAQGLNATGEGDLKNYYDNIAAQQRFLYDPVMRKFDQILARSVGVDPEKMQYVWNSLFQMTDAEKAAIELQNAQRDAIYIDRSIVTEDVVAKELQQEGVYTNITDEYIEQLEEAVMGDDDDGETESDTPEAENSREQETPPEEGETGSSGTST